MIDVCFFIFVIIKSVVRRGLFCIYIYVFVKKLLEVELMRGRVCVLLILIDFRKLRFGVGVLMSSFISVVFRFVVLVLFVFFNWVSGV